MTRFFKWLFWTVVYCFRRRPTDLGKWLLKTERCHALWWKFRPSAWHNDDGKYWEICFTDERDFVEWPPRTLDVKCHIGEKSGNIVGLTIRDETLVRKDTEG